MYSIKETEILSNNEFIPEKTTLFIYVCMYPAAVVPTVVRPELEKSKRNRITASAVSPSLPDTI